MKCFLCTLITLLFITASPVFSQEVIWSSMFGGPGIQKGFECVFCSDGGYAITGTDGLAFERKTLLIKTNSAGEEEWIKEISLAQYVSTECKTILQTVDNGYILGGFTQDNPPQSDALLLRTDNLGNLLWFRTYDVDEDDWFRHVSATSDGGYIIAGASGIYLVGGLDVFLVKTDSEGITEWRLVYGGSLNDSAFGVIQTADGGYAVAGGTESYGAGWVDGWLIKVDANGSVEWDQTFGGTDFDRFLDLVQTPDGGFLICGYSFSYGFGNQMWLVKTDSSGELEWHQTYGLDGAESASSILLLPDGGCVLAGNSTSFGDEPDIWLVKTDSLGNIDWDAVFSTPDSDIGKCVVHASDGGFVISGRSGYQPSGEVDVCLIKIEPPPTGIPGDFPGQNSFMCWATPNPFSSFTDINYTLHQTKPVCISVFDVTGRIVTSFVSEVQTAGNHTITWNGRDDEGNIASSGIYFALVQAGTDINTVKLVLVR